MSMELIGQTLTPKSSVEMQRRWLIETVGSSKLHLLLPIDATDVCVVRVGAGMPQ